MRRTRRGGIAILISLAILLAFTSAPVTALTLQRTWSANLGSSGRININAYTNGVGSIRYSLKGLRVSATYSVQIRYGTCAKLGSVAARLTSIHTSATRTVSRLVSLSSGQMLWIWSAARRSSFVVRIVSGTSIRCGNFTFRHATRVAVPGLGIDLPIIRGPSAYPPCKVAMYLASVAQPREPGVSFIYAHARTGMFLPLLTRWRIDRGASLIGRTVKVWTSDSRVSYYRITRVRTTLNGMAGVTSLTRERLWLQTSTGPNRYYPKLIVEASRYATYSTTYAASHPAAHPISC
jgi:Sortase family.